MRFLCIFHAFLACAKEHSFGKVLVVPMRNYALTNVIFIKFHGFLWLLATLTITLNLTDPFL